MNTFSSRMIALTLALASAGAASAGVTVSFVDPQRYADMPFAPWEKDMVMQDLDKYLVKLGEKWLPAGQELKIDILDIDLAGRLRFTTGREIRVLNGGADWPMIEVRYTLESGGKALNSGTQRITDMNYLRSHVTNTGQSRESLYYEKRMLEDWFKAKFAAQQN